MTDEKTVNVLIIGAGSSVGRAAIESLQRLAAKAPDRPVKIMAGVRHPQKAKAFPEGVDVEYTDMNKPDTLVDPLSRASVVLLVPPVCEDMVKLTTSAMELIKKAANVRRTVLISSVDSKSKTVWGKQAAAIEEQAVLMHLTTCTLKCGAFMENGEAHLAEAKAEGTVTHYVNAARKWSPIAVRDVGYAAAIILLDKSKKHDDKAYVLTSKAHDFAGFAQTVGEVLKKPVKYKQVGRDAVEKTLSDAGLSKWMVTCILETFDLIQNTSNLNKSSKDYKKITGSDPTSLKHWLNTAVKGKSAAGSRSGSEEKLDKIPASGGSEEQLAAAAEAGDGQEEEAAVVKAAPTEEADGQGAAAVVVGEEKKGPPPRILVIGSSGNIGKATIERFSARFGDQRSIVAGVRDPNSNTAQALAKLPGVEVVQADLDKPDTLAPALAGTDTVFLVTPGDAANRVRLANAGITAAKDAGVKTLVLVSITGADEKELIFGQQMAAIESHLKQSGLPHVILRLPNFFSNYFWDFNSMKSTDAFYGPQDPEKPFSAIAVEDVGIAAAIVLNDPAPHLGKTYNLVAASHSKKDVAEACSKLSGHRIKYVRLDYATAREGYLKFGMPEITVDGLLQLCQLVDKGGLNTFSEDFATLVGRPALTIQEWLTPLAPLFTGEERKREGVLVVGSSGNVGTATVTAFAQLYGQKGSTLFAGVRNVKSDKAEALAKLPGVKVVDAGFGSEGLAAAMETVHTVFLVTPPAESERTKTSIDAIELAKAAGVKAVVLVSISFVEVQEMIFSRQILPIETHLKQSGLPYVILRLPFFFDNYYGDFPSIKQHGAFYTPQNPAKPFSAIAVSDIGTAAAMIINNPAPHLGKTYNLVAAPHSKLDFADACSKLSQRSVGCVHVEYPAFKQTLLGYRMSEILVDGILEISKHIDAGHGVLNSDDFATVTGRPALTIKQWLEPLAPLYTSEEKKKEGILVVGSTGNVGLATVKAFASQFGATLAIHAGVRDVKSDKAQALGKLQRVNVVPADFGSPQLLLETMREAHTVFLVTPGAENRTELTLGAIDAAVAAGVKHLVVVSLPQMELTETIFIKQFAPIEQRVRSCGIPFTLLRLPFFLENNLAHLATIKNQDAIYGPQDGSRPFAPISVEDVGAAAATILANPAPHVNKVYVLTTRPFNCNQLAAAFAKEAGKPVKYVRVPYATARKAMLDAGFPAWQVAGIIEMHQIIDTTNVLNCATNDFKTITERDPITMEQWVANAWKLAGAIAPVKKPGVSNSRSWEDVLNAEWEDHVGESKRTTFDQQPHTNGDSKQGSGAGGATQGTLVLRVANWRTRKGKVRVCVFSDKKNKEWFKGEKDTVRTIWLDAVPADEVVEIRVPDLPFYNSYAVTVLHNMKGTGKLDTGAFGVMKDGIAFSNNKGDSFSDAKFSFGVDGQTVALNMTYGTWAHTD